MMYQEMWDNPGPSAINKGRGLGFHTTRQVGPWHPWYDVLQGSSQVCSWYLHHQSSCQSSRCLSNTCRCLSHGLEYSSPWCLLHQISIVICYSYNHLCGWTVMSELCTQEDWTPLDYSQRTYDEPHDKSQDTEHAIRGTLQPIFYYKTWQSSFITFKSRDYDSRMAHQSGSPFTWLQKPLIDVWLQLLSSDLRSSWVELLAKSLVNCNCNWLLGVLGASATQLNC